MKDKKKDKDKEEKDCLELPFRFMGITIEAKKPGVRYLTKEEIDNFKEIQCAAIAKYKREKYRDGPHILPPDILLKAV